MSHYLKPPITHLIRLPLLLGLLILLILPILLSCTPDLQRDEKLRITELSASAINRTSIRIQWKELIHAIDYSVIQKKIGSEMYHRVRKEASTTNPASIRFSEPSHALGVTEITIKGLSPNTTYKFRITALTNEKGYANSDFAEISGATAP